MAPKASEAKFFRIPGQPSPDAPCPQYLHELRNQVVHLGVVLCTCFHSPQHALFAIVGGCAARSGSGGFGQIIEIFAPPQGKRAAVVIERRITYK